MGIAPKDLDEQKKAIAAAKAEILAAIRDTDARLELGMVKSIQRGSVTTQRNGNLEINISNIDPAKSIVILDAPAGDSGTRESSAYVNSLTKTVLTIWCQFIHSGISIGWQVIEFY